jgi:hypothetical protein
LGTGLGLSLVRGVAKSAGGSVVIESEPGQGTTVVLNLPVAAQFHPQTTGGPESARSAVISIPDRRAAMFVSAMMNAARFTTRIANGQPSGSSLLWVIEPASTTIQEVRDYLRGDRRRRVVVFGQPPEAWSTLGAYVIDDPTDFDMIRAALGDAMAAVSRATA